MDTNTTTVRSVERALAILESFSKQRSTLSLAQIAQIVDLPTTTVLRLLNTLESKGFILKDSSTGLYSLGWKIAKIGSNAFAGLDICNVAYPFIEQLHAQYNESFGLYVARGYNRYCVARIDSTHSFRQCVNIGSSRPLDTGAAGHVLLAYGDSPEVLELRKTSKFATPAVLAEVRESGYSCSFGEHIPGITSVAAPIFNANNAIEAALIVTGPAIRIDKNIPEFASVLKEKAAAISSALGYQS